jgi:hypothetical protein
MNEAHARKNVLKRVCADLGLPVGDAYTQDWAYELAEEYRRESWAQRYLDAYGNPAYGKCERIVLLEVILDVVNDLLQEDKTVGHHLWARTKTAIQGNSSTHRAQIEYWAANGEALEDTFALAPLARELLSEQ